MSTNASLQQARQLLEEKGEADAAAAKYQAALDAGATGRDAAEAHVGLARVKLAKRDEPGAEAHLKKALAADPKYGEAHTYLGLQARDRETSFAELRKGVELAPDSFAANYNLANAFLYTQQYAEAIPYYVKATQVGPKSFQAHYELGFCYLQGQEIQKAVQAFLKTLELNPAFVPAAVVLADMALDSGQPKNAELFLMAVRQYNDNVRNPMVLQRLVNVQRLLGDMGKALEFADEWVVVAPSAPEAHYELAMLRLLNGDIQGAEAAAKRHVENFPKDWQGPFLLGMLYEAVKLRDKAKEQYAKATELGPGEWKPFNNLGKMLIEEEDRTAVRQGMEKLQKARSLGPEVPAVLFNLALGYAKVEEEQWAKKLAQQVSQNKSAPDELRRQAADLLRRLPA